MAVPAGLEPGHHPDAVLRGVYGGDPLDAHQPGADLDLDGHGQPDDDAQAVTPGLRSTRQPVVRHAATRGSRGDVAVMSRRQRLDDDARSPALTGWAVAIAALPRRVR